MGDDDWSLIPSVQRELWQANWGQIGKELLAFAVVRARIYRWRTGGIHLLARGMELQDVVQDVIDKTLRGQRQWKPDKGPLVPWLMDQVKSEIDALAKSAAHRREESLEPDWQDAEGWDRAEEQAVLQKSASYDAPSVEPERILIESEDILSAEKKVGALFEAISSEQELEVVVQAVLDGCEPKPRYLAEHLGVPVEDINNRVKRLRRRAFAIPKDLENGQAKGT
jgi:DNA-directed RNA polymerase specialized sigma24 family protein